MSTKKIIIIVIIILIILGAISNNDKDKTKNTTNISQTTSISDGQVGIVSHKMTSMWCVEAIVKNNTHRNLNYIAITATCWDKDGNNLGTATGSQQNINTTDNYKINIFCPSGTDKYELSLKYSE